jgi:hypothetical protein
MSAVSLSNTPAKKKKRTGLGRCVSLLKQIYLVVFLALTALALKTFRPMIAVAAPTT